MEPEIQKNSDIKTAITAGAEMALAAQECRYIPALSGADTPYLIIPDGMHVADMRNMLPPTSKQQPRKSGRVNFYRSDDFVGYINDFKTQNTRIFIDRAQKFCCEAILDYHSPDDSFGDFCDFRASLSLDYSPEYYEWIGYNDNWISQIDFAEFIEENYGDLIVGKNNAPTAAEMLQVARTLEAKKQVDFKSGVRLSNGDVDLSYVETTTARAGEKGSIAIPSYFYIAIPIFQGEQTNHLEVQLRYKLDSGKVFFKYKIKNLKRMLMEHQDVLVSELSEILQIPIWSGKYVS